MSFQLKKKFAVQLVGLSKEFDKIRLSWICHYRMTTLADFKTGQLAKNAKKGL
jgi:hypothetical protein